jgi:hypothetical protein
MSGAWLYWLGGGFAKEAVNPFPSITRAGVERYKELRAASRDLSHRILETLPGPALDEIGKAIGVLRHGVLVFGSEDEMSVLMDCCLYDWVDAGKNAIHRYAETHTPPPGTDAHVLLQAYLRAKYRLLVPKAVLRGAGVSVADAFSGEEFFLMDISLSQSTLSREVLLATRTIPLGEYWITGGAPLPMDAKAKNAAFREFSERGLVVDGTITDPHEMALVTVRACLESDAAGNVKYEHLGSQRLHSAVEGPRPRLSSPTPPRNAPCPCGSGKKYKKCCGTHGSRS